jgi:2-methylaconitate cis-trans-isomerase PrpF
MSLLDSRRLPAVFMRGGTSKALMFRRADLPERRDDWDALLLAAMGSPDPNGRQLNGMGGGLSSVSKVCVVGPSSRADADVDYTFAQVMIDAPRIDYGGNCGNMSSAVGPFAFDEGLVAPRPDARGEVTVRIHNTNTGKIIAAWRFSCSEPSSCLRLSFTGSRLTTPKVHPAMMPAVVIRAAMMPRNS